MIHLHTHSVYSILDGLGKVKDIVAKAKEMKAPAVAITDHASISSLPALMKEAKAAGIKPIVGCEFYFVDDASVCDKNEKRNHLTVWAKNWNGVLSIMEKLTLANNQFYKRPRLSWRQCFEFKDCIIGTACISGVLSLPDYADRVNELIAVYGKDNVFLEIMPYAFFDGDMDIQRIVNKRAIELYAFNRAKYNLLATADAHYTNKEDALTHEVLLAIQTGATWDDPDRWKFGEAVYMMSHEEMINSFEKLGYHLGITGDAINNAFKLADSVDIVMPKHGHTLPSPYAKSENMDVFERLILKGWQEKVIKAGLPKDVYSKRLIYEIEVIQRLGFTEYFLIVEDIIRWARSNGIMVGSARGSSAGSLVCYLLNITQVDPIKHGLYFERFLNPERIDLPDIDIDFQDDRREEVFNYMIEKYGVDKTARINTFGELSIKSAFRDVCRVFKVDLVKVNMLSKLIEDEESFDKVPALVSFAKANPQIVEQAKKLDGVIRQRGVHACGFFVSSKPISDVAVIEKRDGLDVANWDMKQSEDFGLVKIDILGLSTLTVLQRTQKLLKENRGIEIDFVNIPLDDELTLAAFSRGEGVGIFQFENSGMQSLLKAIRANTFEMITDVTALFRPGSLNSGQTQEYVKIARGEEYENYLCEQLKPILKPTKGVMVYQEQIMQIFNQLAGFTWAEADKMRKIIGKKLGKDEFEKHRAHFIDGCLANGINEKISAAIFDKMIEFAAYSFNKSHAVAYSLTSFWSMYLKVRYPVEFLASAMSYAGDDRTQTLVKECERLGIEVALPDINNSEKLYKPDTDSRKIFAPLGCIKGVGIKAVDAILKAREEGGVFLNIKDFQDRVEKRIVNIRVVDIMKRAGAFESLGIVEADAAKRSKDFAELLPVYSVAPTLNKKGLALNKEEIIPILQDAKTCGATKGLTQIMPKALGARPSIMIVNNPVKGEIEHLTNDGSKFLLQCLKAVGISQSAVYYTSPMKCIFAKGVSVPKDCQAKCYEFLRREIAVVKPSLIVCFASDALPFFGEKNAMSKVAGNLSYNREFDAYVLYSYSPQYAYFQDEKKEAFLKVIEKIKGIFL